jgi:hypothetical protein
MVLQVIVNPGPVIRDLVIKRTNALYFGIEVDESLCKKQIERWNAVLSKMGKACGGKIYYDSLPIVEQKKDSTGQPRTVKAFYMYADGLAWDSWLKTTDAPSFNMPLAEVGLEVEEIDIQPIEH